MSTNVGQTMPKNRNHLQMLLFSAVLLVVPLLFWGLWLLVFSNNPDASQEEKLVAFFSYFPEFMSDQLVISLLVLTFSLVAVVFASIDVQRSSGPSKLPGIFIIIAGSFFVLLQLYSMM